jgi:hypothetical protein
MKYGGALEAELPRRARSAPDVPWSDTIAQTVTPTPDLRDVEGWVRAQIERLRLPTVHATRLASIRTKNLGLVGWLEIDGASIPVDELRVYITPGDGTCLIHSFLTSLSPSYHTLSNDDKTLVGVLYRRRLGEHPFFRDVAASLVRCLRRTETKCTYQNLDQTTGQRIARFLDVNVLFLTSDGVEVDRAHVRPGRADVMIVNQHMHYEAVELPFEEPFDESHDDRVRVRDAFHASLDGIHKTSEDDLSWYEHDGLPPVEVMREMLTEMGVALDESDVDEYVAGVYVNMFKGGRSGPRRRSHP